MKKIKKVIIISIIAICIGLTAYQINDINKNNKQIEEIQTQIQEKEKISQEYTELYNEITKEVDDIENVSKKINLLKRTIKENEELYTLLQQDLENLKEQNNKLEKELISLINKKKMKKTLSY